MYGHTQTQEDHYIQIGDSYVLQPFIYSLENNVFGDFVNPYLASQYKLNITVPQQTKPWMASNCNDSTYLCDTTGCILFLM